MKLIKELIEKYKAWSKERKLHSEIISLGYRKPFNKEYDKRLREVLEKEDTEYVLKEKYTVIINGTPVWVGNFPYSYGHVSHESDFEPDDYDCMPSPETNQLLKKKVEGLQRVDFDKLFVKPNKGK